MTDVPTWARRVPPAAPTITSPSLRLLLAEIRATPTQAARQDLINDALRSLNRQQLGLGLPGPRSGGG